jgi:hypothetical protein
MQALTERIEMRFDQDTLQAVDMWRSQQAGVPSRSEAVRQLVELGLATAQDSRLRLTKAEQLIVHLLCETMKAQKLKTELDPEFIQSALYNGHQWGIAWQYSGLFPTDVDDPAVVGEVVDILDMWDFIEGSFAKLNRQQKDRVLQDGGVLGDAPEFSGFDANNEIAHMGVARFFIRDLERFSRFKQRELNSHNPTTLPRYRRMLSIFLPLRGTLTGGAMSEAQLIEVLKVEHPKARKS